MRTFSKYGVAFAIVLSGCAGGHGAIPAMQDVERIRSGPAALAGKQYAPQMFAIAEQEREKSRAAYDADDDATAEIYAEAASVSYQHAFVLARLTQATMREAAAKKALADAEDEASRYEKARADLQKDTDALEKRLAVARDALVPAASGLADPKREAARLVSARALVTQARLLCGAAEIIGADAKTLADPEKNVADLEKQLEGAPKPVPIDAAAAARASCLGALTKARRANARAGGADALLSELSATGKWTPSRDERGVVVTLRDLFSGTTLTSEGAAKIAELGRVLAAHPGVAAQVVVHDAAQPSTKDAAADKERADAVAKAIGSSAGSAAKVRADLAGARAPLVDPSDAKHRARNARVDVVFVTQDN